MAALPKKKISKVRGKTRRGQIKASLTSLVKSKKFPGLSVPHRFRKYFDSLTATDKDVVRAGGAGRKSLVSQTVKRIKPMAKKPAGIKPSKSDASTIAAVKKSRKTASKAKMPEAGE
jgi:ribosomal protein L32